jgi:hypothetical protein
VYARILVPSRKMPCTLSGSGRFLYLEGSYQRKAAASFYHESDSVNPATCFLFVSPCSSCARSPSCCGQPTYIVFGRNIILPSLEGGGGGRQNLLFFYFPSFFPSFFPKDVYLCASAFLLFSSFCTDRPGNMSVFLVGHCSSGLTEERISFLE